MKIKIKELVGQKKVRLACIFSLVSRDQHSKFLIEKQVLGPMSTSAGDVDAVFLLTALGVS